MRSVERRRYLFPLRSVLRHVADKVSSVLEVSEPSFVVGDSVDDVVTDVSGGFYAAPDDLGGVAVAQVDGGAARIVGFVFGGDSAEFDADDGHAMGFGVVATHDFAGYFGDAIHPVGPSWRINVDASWRVGDVIVAGFDH